MQPSVRTICTLSALLWLSNVPAQVASPISQYNGKSAVQLAAEWWQWAASAPVEENPIRDLSGANCGVSQRGDIWFLAGGFGSSKIQRHCHVPAGKPLYFPLVNMVYWPQRGNTTYTCEIAKQHAALNNDTAIDLFAEVDGVPVQNLRGLRVATDQCFNLYGRIPASELRTRRSRQRQTDTGCF
jgi:hypothetical protein